MVSNKFKVQSRNLPDGGEEDHAKPQSIYFVCQLRFEKGVCEMKMRSFRARTAKPFMAKGHTGYCRLVRRPHVDK